MTSVCHLYIIETAEASLRPTSDNIHDNSLTTEHFTMAILRPSQAHHMVRRHANAAKSSGGR